MKKTVIVLSLLLAAGLSAFAIGLPGQLSPRAAEKISAFERKFLAKLTEGERKEAVLFLMDLMNVTAGSGGGERVVYITNTVTNTVIVYAAPTAAPAPAAESKAMSAGDFQEFFNSWKEAPFMSDQEQIMNSTLKANYFTLDQLLQILDAMQSDSQKMPVIRLAYPRVVEGKSAAYKVLKKLDFPSNKDEVQKIINANP